MRRLLPFFLSVFMMVSLLAGCGSSTGSAGDSDKAAATTESSKAELADGMYTADFDTHNNMFHVNEAKDGKGLLVVKDGKMTIHVSLVSTNIVNLFIGTKEDAQKEGAELLEPTTDKVTYSDGYTEDVYGFNIPVPGIDEDFAVAIIGTEGKWYDHTCTVSNPVPYTEDSSEAAAGDTSDSVSDSSNSSQTNAEISDIMEDGTYTMDVTLEGGSGRADIESPVTVDVIDGKATATIVWSSEYYDYMIVEDTTYQPFNTEGNSVFVIPVSVFDTPIDVTADTTRMSTAHEIDYTLTFDSASAQKVK